MSYPIEVEELSAEFSSRKEKVVALEGLSFHVAEGDVVGFIGPNGAGKTTTIHILLGFVDPSSGRAKIFGEDVGRQSSRQRIGYLPEHPESYKFLRGEELLRMSGSLFGMRGRHLQNRVDEVLEMVDLRDAGRRKIGTYSRGMMQRIGVAQTLVNDPDLLILDEPTGGLDPLGRMAMRDIISRLKDHGKTVFFSSHELSEVERVCDRIILVGNGKLVAEGRVEDLIEDNQSLEQFFVERVCGAKGVVRI